jgi:hypothetical protein
MIISFITDLEDIIHGDTLGCMRSKILNKMNYQRKEKNEQEFYFRCVNNSLVHVLIRLF